MIFIRFGTWQHAGERHFLYWRIYYKGYKWTPLCRMEWRYKDKGYSVKALIFATYENLVMGTRLGRFRLAQIVSQKLYKYLFTANLSKD